MASGTYGQNIWKEWKTHPVYNVYSLKFFECHSLKRHQFDEHISNRSSRKITKVIPISYKNEFETAKLQSNIHRRPKYVSLLTEHLLKLWNIPHDVIYSINMPITSTLTRIRTWPLKFVMKLWIVSYLHLLSNHVYRTSSLKAQRRHVHLYSVRRLSRVNNELI